MRSTVPLDGGLDMIDGARMKWMYACTALGWASGAIIRIIIVGQHELGHWVFVQKRRSGMEYALSNTLTRHKVDVYKPGLF